MITLMCLNVETPKENDDKQWLTDFEGEFFPDVYERVLYLGGRSKNVPRGTAVWIVLRANGRMLLQTDDKFHRWADKSFLQHRK